jgi:hypothetical protein
VRLQILIRKILAKINTDGVKLVETKRTIMPEYVVIGSKINTASIRDFLFAKRIDKGDSLVLNPIDYEHLLEEIKHSEEPIPIPLNVLGVLILKDPSGDVPVGKVQIVEDDKM